MHFNISFNTITQRVFNSKRLKNHEIAIYMQYNNKTCTNIISTYNIINKLGISVYSKN